MTAHLLPATTLDLCHRILAGHLAMERSRKTPCPETLEALSAALATIRTIEADSAALGALNAALARVEASIM